MKIGLRWVPLGRARWRAEDLNRRERGARYPAQGKSSASVHTGYPPILARSKGSAPRLHPEWGLANHYKGLDCKYFTFCGPCGLRHHRSTLWLKQESSHGQDVLCAHKVPIKLYFQKQAENQVGPPGLSTLAHCTYWVSTLHFFFLNEAPADKKPSICKSLI